MKQFLLMAVEEFYYRPLRNITMGYATVSTKDILDHIYDSYGNITESDLSDNDNRFRTPYDSEQPIEFLYDQVESEVEF